MTREEINIEISYCNQVEGAIINGYCCETIDNLLYRIMNYHEAQLKAKDEEIHYLKTQMTGYSMMFDEPQDAIHKEDQWPS